MKIKIILSFISVSFILSLILCLRFISTRTKLNVSAEIAINTSEIISLVENETGLCFVDNILDIFKNEKNMISKIDLYTGVIHRDGDLVGSNVVYIKVYSVSIDKKNILYTYDLADKKSDNLRRLYRSHSEAFEH